MTQTHILGGLFIAVALGASGAAGVAVYEQQQLEQEVTLLEEAVAQAQARTDNLEETVVQKEEEIEAQKELIRAIRQQATASAYDFSQIRQMIEEATQTVTDIKKLEEADPELLAKYSKVYFLNEHYVPDTLVYIPSEHVIDDRQLRVKEEVRPFLLDMLDVMENVGLEPRIVSAYRSFDYQEDLKHTHAVEYGTSEANRFIADQGYSEHQLGTTVDIATAASGGTLSESFEDTEEYAWLRENAHTFGFTLSYPRNNAYYEFEPWHWRFVGIDLATHLHEQGIHFYDMSQREINDYRIDMFER